MAGNWIGTDISGSVALNNGTQPVTDSLGNVFGGGVAISAGASGNRIGTDGKSVDDVGERNVIAGSGNDGIDIYGTGTDGNVVAGNFIGTDVTGTRSLGIAGDGVFLAEGASSNWIGVNPSGGAAIQDEGNRHFRERQRWRPDLRQREFQRRRREQDRHGCHGDGRPRQRVQRRRGGRRLHRQHHRRDGLGRRQS